MTPRPKKHDTPADCIAAHRQRKAGTHRRVEITLTHQAAEKLKRTATDEATTPSLIIERLLAALPDPPA